MKRVPKKGIHNSTKNERRDELRKRHEVLKEKVEDEKDEGKRVRIRI